MIMTVMRNSTLYARGPRAQFMLTPQPLLHLYMEAAHKGIQGCIKVRGNIILCMPVIYTFCTVGLDVCMCV